MDSPLVSVIMPVYNGERYLAEAIDSVLAQAWRPLEVIVIDDGSSDGTGRVMASYGDRITALKQDNQGTPAARNKGLLAAQGGIISFLDADDTWPPDKLAVQMPLLTGDERTDAVIGRPQYFRPAGDDAGAFEPFLEPRLALNLGAALIKKRLFDRIGLLDETLRHGDDWDWFMRCREAGANMVFHDEVVLRQRLHADNITRDRQAGDHYTLLMFKKSLDRRRGQGRALDLPPLADFRQSGRGGDKDGG